jgi:uncharacterized transporter YbjL
MADMPSTASKVMEWSRPVIAVFGLIIFALSFAIAWWSHDTGLQNILTGAIVAMVSTITGYYFGSSAGTQKKDDVIGAIAQAPTPPPVVVAGGATGGVG